MIKTVKFFRDFRGFTGGHLKVWHYYQHCLQHSGYRTTIFFTPDSKFDASNPWKNEPGNYSEPIDTISADMLFIGGRDWQYLPPGERIDWPKPVINLVQGIRHADIGSELFNFLSNKAIRICVSPEVRNAICATGLVNGPVFTIPNGLDTLHISAFRQETARKSLDMVIVGVKQPLLAFELLQHARKMNLRTVSISQLVTRDRFLEILGSARLALLLPLEQEGFYLPALEAMGTNTLVICPDCIGNRSFCRNGMNALVPDYSTEGIILMLKKAIQMSTTDISSMLEAAMATFHQHDLNFEREQFHWILDHADDLWKDAPDKQQ